MSSSSRGDDVAADHISRKNVQDLLAKIHDAKQQFELVDALDALGGDELVKDVFGDPSQPLLAGKTTSLTSPEMVQQFLCEACRGIFTTEVELCDSWQPHITQRILHHGDARSLYGAAREGCHLCTILWNRIFDGAPLGAPDEDIDMSMLEFITYSVCMAEKDEFAYLINFVYQGNELVYDEDICRRLQICIIPAKDLVGIVTDCAVSSSMASEATFEFARSCIDLCRETHTKCSEVHAEHWLPTRLVDLGSLEEPLKACLHIVGDDTIQCPYVTLSHRWGSVKVFKLTLSTLDSMLIDISIAALPRTFQDAFSTAKRLGVRYIWVDSLCIIQDSFEDWHEQAAVMGEVYAHALCNISATGALDSERGLFVDRNEMLIRPCLIMLNQSGPWSEGTYYLLDSSLWSTDVSDAPLNTRAWVLQERVLAQRILHFGKDQLHFECRELDACETYPYGLPNSKSFRWRPLGSSCNGNFKRLDPNLDGALHRERNSGGRLASDEALNAYSLWAELVETYSGLELTHVDDKLIAFSAIAKRMQRLLHDEYLAGLWKRHLPYQLLWTKCQEGIMRIDSLKCRAPSWSWASTATKVTLYPIASNPDQFLAVDIIHSKTIPIAADETGQLMGASLELQSDGKEPYHTPSSIIVWPDRFDNTTVWIDEFDTNGAENRTHPVYCLPVHIWWNQDGDRCTEGLILAEAGGEWNKTFFRRVGRFKIPLTDKESQDAFYGNAIEDLRRNAFSETGGLLKEGEWTII